MSIAFSEEWYFVELRRGAYYTAAGIAMDALSSLLASHSAIDPVTGQQMFNDADELMQFLTWILGDSDGERVTRWLYMLSTDPQSTEVLIEVVQRVRDDVKRILNV